MNRQCYRIVFNKARGMLMVVSEAAKSHTKAAGQTTGNSVTASSSGLSKKPSELSVLALSCLLVNTPLLTQAAYAGTTQITPDKTASILNQPTILQAKNGTPVINIRAANGQGISRNVYGQLDVLENGVILNNSRFGANTQLAGKVDGNFWLAFGEANTIVNEVNSSNPMKFNGKMEVAGSTANVIIASPAGININGGGFINAQTGTLTTGKVNYDNSGNITGININQGQVAIDTKGLNNQFDHGVSMTNILAKTVKLNGQVTGTNQDLVQIVTGENDIKFTKDTYSLSDSDITNHQKAGSPQGVALDVGQLGGAYASGIRIIGTDKGMGVTNAGNFKANDWIVLTNNGRIENKGSLVVGNNQSSTAQLMVSNTPEDSEQGDIVNSGVMQAGNRVVVQAGRDLTGNGKIVRDSQVNVHDQLEELTLTAERDMRLGDITNSNKKGDVQLIAGGKLEVQNATHIDTTGNVIVSGGDSVTLNNTTIQTTGDDKAIRIYSGKDLQLNTAQLNSTGKNGSIGVAATKNQTLNQTNIKAANLYNQTGETLTIDQATLTSTGEGDLDLIAGSGIHAKGLNATAQNGSVHLEAAKASLLETPTSDISLTDSTLKATKNTDILADRHITVQNTNLQGEQIRSTAGENLNLGLTGQNRASKNVYLKAGKELNIQTANDKLESNHIEAMAQNINLADNTQLQANAGDIKLTATTAPFTDETDAKHDINLGKNTQLTANGNIAVSSDQGTIRGTDVTATAQNSVGLVANKGIAFGSEDSQKQNRLTASTGNVGLIAQGEQGIQATNLNIIATQGKAQLATVGGIDINASKTTQAVTQTTPTIQAQSIHINNKTSVPTTTNGRISIQDTDLQATSDKIVVNSQDALTLERSNLKATGNIELHGDAATSLANVTSQSDKHTALSSDTTMAIASSNITSTGVLSNQSKLKNSLKDSQLQGGALLLNSEQSGVEFGKDVTLTTKASTLLANDPTLAAVNGSMTVKSHDDMIIEAGRTIDSEGDVDLRTQGKLQLLGTGGNTGNGSQTNVKITAKGSVGLTGSDVETQGSDITATEGGINIFASEGNVKIGAIQNTIDGVKPENRVQELNEELAKIDNNINTLNNDAVYQQATKDLADANAKLEKLVADNAQTPIADFEAQKQALKTQIATHTSTLNVRVAELNINKTIDELTADKEDTVRSLDIANTPYTGIEHYGTNLTANGDVTVVAKGGIAMEASDINTKGHAVLQSMTHQGELRQIIDEEARADIIVPLMRLNKLTDAQKQNYLATQLAKIDNLVFSLDSTINQGPDVQKLREQLKTLLPKAVNGDLQSQKDVRQLLASAPPVTVIPVAITIEGLNDIYQRGEEGDDIFSLHNNNRASSITADKGILIQATGADNTDPSTVTTTGAPNNIIINSGTYTAKDGDIQISSVGNVILQAAQDSIYDEETKTKKKKSWGGLKKKVTITHTTEDIRNADPVTLIGNNISVNAGDNIYGYATEFKAPEGTTNLQAGDALRLFAVQEVEDKDVDVKKTSSFIGIKYNKDHRTDTHHVASDPPSTLVANVVDTGSGDDTYLQGTEFEYLQGANIKAGVGMKAVPDAKIIFDTINKTVAEQYTREFNNIVWQSMSDNGSVTETADLPKFTGPTTPNFSAPGGLVVQVPLTEAEQKDSTNLVNVINRMGNQPGFEYLQDIAKRNDVNFSAVQLAQKDWDYKQEGLTPAAAALIGLAVTVATGGTGATFLPAGLASNATAVAATNAAFSSLASQATVTLINNKGDIGKTLKDLGSSATAKQLAFAAVSAGVSAQLNSTILKDVGKEALNDRFIRGIVDGTSSALVDSAINGTSLETALKNSLRSSLVDAGTGYVFTNGVKGLDSDRLIDNIAHKLAAGLVGCASAELKDKSCEAGALGATIGEMVGDYLVRGEVQALIDNNLLSPDKENYILNQSKLIVGSIALLYGLDINQMVESAELAVTNNALKPTKYKWGKVSAEAYEKALEEIVPRNMALAGKTHPVTGVPFTKDGYPDFSAYLYMKNGMPVDVNIGQLTGDRAKDFELANAAANLAETPANYTWHHNEQLGRMQLVRTDIHNKTGHTGGHSIYSKAIAAMSGLYVSITEANADDYADFAIDVFTPWWIAPTTIADGTPDGYARQKGFKNMQEMIEFENYKKQLQQNSAYK